jgi:hypothetical protein
MPLSGRLVGTENKKSRLSLTKGRSGANLSKTNNEEIDRPLRYYIACFSDRVHGI